MNKLPYRVIINRNLTTALPINSININIPKYFGNYNYFKIILKEVTCSNRNQDLWLNCDTSTFNQISQDIDPSVHNANLDKFIFNLTAYREGASQFNYVILPYRDTIKFWFTNMLGKKPGFDVTVTMIIELEPYEI